MSQISKNNKSRAKFREILNFEIENTAIKNESFRKLLKNYLEEYYPIFESLGAGWERHQNVRASKIFIKLIDEFIRNQKEVNWNNFCNMMQRLNELVQERINIRNVAKKIREMIIKFYMYVYENVPLVRSDIEKFKHLLIKNEVNYVIPYLEVRDAPYYYTNFPKDSTPENIFQLFIDDMEGKAPRLVNIFFNTNNPFLYKLFEHFTLYCIQNICYENSFVSKKESINLLKTRAFYYLFEESLKRTSLIKEQKCEEWAILKNFNSLDIFNPLTFMEQYQFFKKFDREVNYVSFSSAASLIRFYLYIDDLSIQQTGKSILNVGTFSRDILFKSRMLKYIELGYEILVLSPFEPIPDSNKWCVLPKNKDKFISLSSKNNFFIDFTEVTNKKFQNDLKKYVWNYKDSQARLITAIPRIINFLNLLDKFLKEIKETIPLHRNEINNLDDFLLKYRALLKNKKTKKGESIKEGTYMQIISQIKQYLRFYQEKYAIPELTFQYLKTKSVKQEGGNPFDAEDFIEIKKAFLKMKEDAKDKNELIEAELANIIFSLSCQTKLRQGEICNLKRDCILSISQALGVGEISYISKTSNGERITTYILLEDIQLIQKAIELTNEYNYEANSDYKDYIFLTTLSTKKTPNQRIGWMHFKYRFTFNKIVRSLYKSGKIKKYYEPNDARDTFIDSAWKQVETGNITPLVAANIAGNTERVAAQSYRKQLDKDYLEITYMITIGGIDVDGTIFETEKEINQLQQVASGAGACNSDDCIKQKEVLVRPVDTDFLCMTCRKFVTCTERAAIFEKRLEMYHEKLEEAENPNEKKYYSALVELYATYLTKILQFSKENYQ
ncbi:integrase [Lysinibacillus composti]|uniref:Uncharacterized protein n=1 Tax=Lysinibacillus composti TaxID=720633 RepID=A0A3N9UJN9_9BACI|nr:hypothetical protein [Lysinibacillus composti]MBM7607246.1 integrase [Lysinibacillus composti]RQW76177.1 hypothetical protein EBB45_01100 [Lysinibacillus composti]